MINPRCLKFILYIKRIGNIPVNKKEIRSPSNRKIEYFISLIVSLIEHSFLKISTNVSRLSVSGEIEAKTFNFALC